LGSRLAQIGLTERPQHKCDEHAQIWDEHAQKSVIFSMWRFGLARWVARSGGSQKPLFWGVFRPATEGKLTWVK
jgi:hypothetical protein